MCFFSSFETIAAGKSANTDFGRMLEIADNSKKKIPTDLVGKNFGDALTELNARGMSYKVRQKLTCDENEKETVLKVERNRQDVPGNIVVTVAKSGAKTSDLFGTMVDDARNTLKLAGFENVEVSGEGLFVTGLSVPQDACVSKKTRVIIMTESDNIKPEGTPDCKNTSYTRLVSRLNEQSIKITEHAEPKKDSAVKTSEHVLRSEPGNR